MKKKYSNELRRRIMALAEITISNFEKLEVQDEFMEKSIVSFEIITRFNPKK